MSHSSNDDIIEEKITGIAYVIRMRRANGGWRMEVLLGNAVEESVVIHQITESNLLKGLKSCFKNLAAPVMDWQLERSTKNLIEKLSVVAFVESDETVSAVDRAIAEMMEKIQGIEQKLNSVVERLQRVEERLAL